jgi:hypothetical protein
VTDIFEYYTFVKEIMDEVYKFQDYLLRSNTNWREHAKLYNELSKIVDILPYPFL